MFLKLFKHDFIDLKNSFFTLFLIVGIISFSVPILWELVIDRIVLNVTNGAAGISLSILVMLIMLLINFFYVVEILFLVVVLRNFSKSFYGNEGYFTLTLPISTAKNVLSKILAMIIWGLMFILIALLGLSLSIALVCIMSPSISLDSLFESFNNLQISAIPSSAIIRLLIGIAQMIVSEVLSLCVILFSMTLAHIKPLNKHSILFTILFLVCFSIISIIVVANIYSLNRNLEYVGDIILLLISIALIPLLILGTIKLIDKKVEIQ